MLQFPGVLVGVGFIFKVPVDMLYFTTSSSGKGTYANAGMAS